MGLPRIARRYAKSFLSIALQRDVADVVELDLEYIVRVLKTSADLRMLFRSPVIEGWRKIAVIAEVFGTDINPLTSDCLRLLIDKGREADIEGVAAEYRKQYDVHRGWIRITVTSAVVMNADMQAAVIGSIEQRTEKKVFASFDVDERLIGGVTVRVGDTILDSSLQHQLEQLRQSLAGSNAQSLN